MEAYIEDNIFSLYLGKISRTQKGLTLKKWLIGVHHSTI